MESTSWKLNALIIGFAVLAAKQAMAGEITSSSFGKKSFVDNFECLANYQDGHINGVLTLNGNKYTAQHGFIRLFKPTETPTSTVCYGGATEGHAPNPGACIGTNSDDFETLTIEFGLPMTKVGLWVGLTERISEPWFWSKANVRFYSEEGALLGSVQVAGHSFEFAGWEAEDKVMNKGQIKWVQVEDVAANSRVVAIDNVVYEPKTKQGQQKLAINCQ